MNQQDIKQVIDLLRNKHPNNGTAGSFLPNDAADMLELLSAELVESQALCAERNGVIARLKHEQSALIEKLGSYLRKAAKSYSSSHCEMICDEALTELAAWRAK